MAKPICVAPTGDWTGEGVLWHAGEGVVYWTDIRRFLVHRYDPPTGNVHTWFFGEPVTSLGLTDRPDTLIVALGSRLILWQPANDARADFANPDKSWPGVRSNDGAPDPAGNFWLGTMENTVAANGTETEMSKERRGRVFRVRPDGSSTVERTDVFISNTFVWSPDATRFYNADSIANAIHVFDYDIHTGAIANERPFFVGYERGVPDGSAMDRGGFIWNARYDGSCVVRISPDGKAAGIIELPVHAVTNCTFGGPSLKTMYITSAGGGNGAAIGEQLAGGLFAVEMEVPGVPENKFRLGG